VVGIALWCVLCVSVGGHTLRSTLGQEYMFSGPWNTGSPVHETITHLALKRAGLTNNKEYDCCKSSEDFSASTQKIVADASNREYLRGVLWNDDPTATLFDNNEEENWDFGLGVAFGVEFKSCMRIIKNVEKNTCSSLMCRSHFGDLQFLHAMANTLCEDPLEIQKRIVRWGEFTYKVAIGEISGGAKLKDISVEGDEFNIGEKLFPLNKDMSVDQLFLVPDSHHCKAPYTSTKRRSGWFWSKKRTVCHYRKLNGGSARKRAAGSLAHMIEDSYAGGHCTRENGNCHAAEYKEKPEGLSLKNCGPILSFNSYLGQDSKKHHYYDNRQGTTEPKPSNTFLKWIKSQVRTYPKDEKRLLEKKTHTESEKAKVRTFLHGQQSQDAFATLSWVDATPGAVESIHQVSELFKLIKEKKPWEAAKQHLLNVFRLSKEADISGHGMGAGRHSECNGVPLPKHLLKEMAQKSAPEIAKEELKELNKGDNSALSTLQSTGVHCNVNTPPPFCACNVDDWKIRHEIVSLAKRIEADQRANSDERKVLQKALRRTRVALKNLWKKRAPPGFKKRNVRNDLLNALRAWKDQESKETEADVMASAGRAFCQSDTTSIRINQLLEDYVGTGALRASAKFKIFALVGKVVDKAKKKRLKNKSEMAADAALS
jgi:hypothetical protein